MFNHHSPSGASLFLASAKPFSIGLMSGEFPAQAMERIPLSWANFLLAHHCWNDIVVQNLNVLSRIHHLLPRQNDQIMRLTAKRSPHCNTYKISNKISIKILMIYQLKWKDWLLIDKGSRQKKCVFWDIGLKGGWVPVSKHNFLYIRN